jgi:hypothetical protein
MKQTKNQIVTLMILVWISSVGLCAEPFAKGPYLGQTPPGPIAQVFAPGLICRSEPRQWEANGTFSSDGNAFCFQRVSGVFITENTDQGWTTPELIKSIPANMYSPWSACLSPDANSIFFTRATDPASERNLYRCNRTANGWSKPQKLGPPLSSPYVESACSIASNNNIYLCSNRKNNQRNWIWVVPFVSNSWSRAVNVLLDHPRPCSPGIAPDESFMVIYSVRPGARPGTETDLYLSLRQPDGTWTKPLNLGPRINSGFYEQGARISPDKKYLFFNRSNGWDPRIYSVHSDICWVEFKEYLPESYR